MLLATTSDSHAQWVRLRTFPFQVQSVYFLDGIGVPNVGFTGLRNGQIWRTSDNGANWVACSTPGTGYVSHFAFKDSLNGWCSVMQSLPTNGIWKTTDGGVNWTHTGQFGNMVSVGYNALTAQLFAICWAPSSGSPPNSLQSADLGLTWTAFAPLSQNGMSFKGSTGIISTLNAPGFLYSSDAGQSWRSCSPNLNAECWSPYCVTSSLAVAIGEKTRGVYVSTNGGAAWNVASVFNFGILPTGCISGTTSNLFVQTQSGFYASSDQGVTWYSVCGPANDRDTRFYSKAKEIFAGDQSGNLWYNHDGTIGGASLFSLDTRRYAIDGVRCTQHDSTYRFTFTSGCGATFARAQILTGAPWFTLGFNPFPRPAFGLDSIRIAYTPSPGLRDSARILLEFVSSGITIDTIITVYGTGRPTADYRINSALSFVLENACVESDSIITIHNAACDTLVLTSASLDDSTNVYFKSVKLPIIIPPQDSARLAVGGRATRDGTYSTYARIHLVGARAIPLDTSVSVTLTVMKSGHPVFASVGYSLMNRCVTLDTSIPLRNTLCDSLTILSMYLPDTTHFQIGAERFPILLAMGEEADVPVHVIGGKKGTYSTTVLVTCRSGSQIYDTTINLTVAVRTDLPVRLTMDKSSLNFGNVSAPCDSTFAVVRLYNSLCGDIKIERISWDQQNGSFNYSARALPITITPDGQDSLILTYHPMMSGTNTIMLRVTMNVDGVRRDTLIRVTGTGMTVFHDTLLQKNLRFDSIAMCESAETGGDIVNLSCGDIVATSYILGLEHGYEVVSPQLPMLLHSHDTIHVRVRLTPKHAGTLRDSITVYMKNVLGGPEYLRTIPIQGYATPTIHAVGLSAAYIDATSLAPCSTLDSSITLANLGTCDDVTITQTDLAGYPGVDLDPAIALPIILHPGERTTLPFHVRPVDSVVNSTLRLHGHNLDTTIAVVYSTRPGARHLTCTVADSSFMTKPCVAVSKDFVLTNDGCDSVLIEDVSLHGVAGQTQFTFLSDVPLPIRLASNENMPITLRYDPDGNGDNTAQLRITSHQTGLDRTVPLRGDAVGTIPSVHVTLMADGAKQSFASEAGFTKSIHVGLQDDIGDSVVVKTVQFALHYDEDQLTNSSIVPIAGWKVASSLTIRPGTLQVTLERTDMSSAIRAGELAQCDFRVTLSDSSTTDIALTDLQLNSGDANFARCALVALPPTEVVHFSAIDECGAEYVRDALRGMLSVRLLSIKPNPVFTSDETASLVLRLGERQTIGIRIFDQLGVEQQATTEVLEAGERTVALDVSHLSSGSYYVRIAGQKTVMSRRLLIER